MTWYLIVVLVIVFMFGLVVFRGSPYVPSRNFYIKQAFTDLYKVTSEDVLVDIGSGDGVVLREAAKKGAKAIGFELNPILVIISRLLSKKHKKVSVRWADFWLVNLPDDTTVVYVFSVTRDIKNIIKKLNKEVDRLGRPVHVISYASELTGMTASKSLEAYYLYELRPLQPVKAQV